MSFNMQIYKNNLHMSLLSTKKLWTIILSVAFPIDNVMHRFRFQVPGNYKSGQILRLVLISIRP